MPHVLIIVAEDRQVRGAYMRYSFGRGESVNSSNSGHFRSCGSQLRGVAGTTWKAVEYWSTTMAKFQAPKEFSFEPVEWAAWRERYERYCRACKLDTEDDAVRIDALIYSMGDKADKIVKTFTYATGEDKAKYDTIIAKFEEYFVPRRNEIYERSIFHSR